MTLLDAPPPATTSDRRRPERTARAARAARTEPTTPVATRRTARWASVRPVAGTDTAGLVAFGRRCSRDSLFHRFLSPMTALPTAHVDDVVAGRGDMVSSVAVLPDGRIVGLATLAPSRSGPPELAVLVEDRWQRQGVGWSLVIDLVDRSRDLGHEQLVVLVSSTRPWILRWLAPVGPFRHELDGPTIEAVFDLA